jgi:hypothetical protein
LGTFKYNFFIISFPAVYGVHAFAGIHAVVCIHANAGVPALAGAIAIVCVSLMQASCNAWHL